VTDFIGRKSTSQLRRSNEELIEIVNGYFGNLEVSYFREGIEEKGREILLKNKTT